MTPREIAQQIFSGPWKFAPAALQACQRRAWAEFAREGAPPKPLVFGRRDYARCLELAEGSLTSPVETRVTLVPLWACQNFETTSNKWVAVNAAAWKGQPLEVQEGGPFIEDASPLAEALWECSVRRWTAAWVVKTEIYDSNCPLKLRAGAFGVEEFPIVEVLSVDVRMTEPLPRPTREAPIFARWFEPRTTVSPELDSQIRAMSFTPSDDDEVDS